jgi:hypothetical protein
MSTVTLITQVDRERDKAKRRKKDERTTKRRAESLKRVQLQQAEYLKKNGGQVKLSRVQNPHDVSNETQRIVKDAARMREEAEFLASGQHLEIEKMLNKGSRTQMVSKVNSDIVKIQKEEQKLIEETEKWDLTRRSMHWKDMNLLKLVASSLGYREVTPVLLRDGEMNSKQEVDILFAKQGFRPVGIIREAAGVEVVSHDSNLEESFIQKASQLYAYVKISNYLKLKGYSVENAGKLPSGEIIIQGIKY